MKDESAQPSRPGLRSASSCVLHPFSFLRGPRMEPDRRPKGPVDHARIEAAVREILLAVGEDPDREGLLETPARVARMYAEMFSGLHVDPRAHLSKTFTQKYDEIV